MLGRAKIDENITVANPAAATFFTPTESVGPESLALKFTVEEEGGMFVEVDTHAIFSHSAGGESVEFTLFLDSGAGPVDVAPGAEGLGTYGLATGDTSNKTLAFRHLLQLDKGEHKLELRLKAATGNVLLPGATWPSYLTVKRASHDAVLAQGVNAKSDDIY